MAGFFTDFLERLCVEEDLVDIGPSGSASQSSVSRWSRPDDAARALRGHFDDFAFHTASEKQAWWRLDFAAGTRLYYVIVENRRNPNFQDVAADLRVEALDSAGDHPLLFSGLSRFGCLPQSMPLVLPVRGLVSCNGLRISANREGPLHLSRVRVLVKRADLEAPRASGLTTVISNRSDGLGQRLWSMLNGIVMAGYYDQAVFRFGWPLNQAVQAADHAIVDRREMFSAAFIAEHELTETWRRPPVSLHAKALQANADKDSLQKHASVVADPEDLFRFIPALREKLPADAFSRAYAGLPFTDKVESARAAALAVPLTGETVAIHLRAGDIIYGRYRFVERFVGKVVPFPLVEALIQECLAAGRSVILFGQDGGVCACLADRYGLIWSERVAGAHAGEPVNQAIFDITLMSRCAVVYAGSSGFSQVAAVIGNSSLVNPEHHFDRKQLFLTIRDSQAAEAGNPAISDMQRAFAWWYGYRYSHTHMGPQEKIDFLEAACGLDPENWFYRLVLASELYLAGRDAQADVLLGGYAGGRQRGSLHDVLSFSHPDGKVNAAAYMDPFHAAEKRGSLQAAACLGFYLLVHGERAQGARLIERCAASALRDQALVCMARELSSTENEGRHG